MAGHFDVALIPEEAEEYFEANRSVLIIEDDRIMGDIVMDTLDDIGFEVTKAATGRIAFEQLKQRRVDFILLDLSLPGMNGFEIYERLQENPETQGTPVLFTTAWDDDENMARAIEVGVRHFLPKPFSEDQLLTSIRDMLAADATAVLASR